MSVDVLGWDKLDGEMATAARDFLDQKFQQLPLPDYIKGVRVLSFDFGHTPPEVELKQIADPFPEFYEEDAPDINVDQERANTIPVAPRGREQYNEVYNGAIIDQRRDLDSSSTTSTQPPPYMELLPSSLASPLSRSPMSPMYPLGGHSNLHYFHSAFPSHIISGYPTPLAMPNMPNPLANHLWNGNNMHPSTPPPDPLRRQPSMSISPPTSGGEHDGVFSRPEGARTPPSSPMRATSPRLVAERRMAPEMLREPKDDDIQVVARVKYNGDIKLELTAELLVNYPSPSFVCLPMRLGITGVTFDGDMCLAHTSGKFHVCFLDDEQSSGILKHVHVESEIGEKERGLLKNVGNVEKFVHEQLQEMLDEELVFPSFWTIVQ